MLCNSIFTREDSLGPDFHVVVQLLGLVWLSVTPWTAAGQSSLSFTISWSLLILMSIESVMPSNHLILLFIPFSSCLQSCPASESFPMSWLYASGGQRIVVSASTSVLSWNTQDWSPLSSLGIVTSVAVNIWSVCVFLWIIVFSAYVSNSGIVGSCAFSFCF